MDEYMYSSTEDRLAEALEKIKKFEVVATKFVDQITEILALQQEVADLNAVIRDLKEERGDIEYRVTITYFNPFSGEWNTATSTFPTYESAVHYRDSFRAPSRSTYTIDRVRREQICSGAIATRTKKGVDDDGY